ncbi:MAG: DUF3224 domain-containing protein [Caulobacteraceae bacterium]
MRTAAAILAVLFAPVALAKPPQGETAGMERRTMQTARGDFEVQMTPEATSEAGIGRLSLKKTFRGDLEGTSTGEMLGVRTSAPGSAGYVLIEHVVGRLEGRSGGFMLQHFGVMDRNRPEMKIVVIPDSATGDLAGLTGDMTIDAAAGHAYVFSYSPPGPR